MIEGLQDKRVVALPDLFLDVLVPLPRWVEARRGMDAIAARGGGNLPVAALEVCLGGNALNLAGALSAMGAQAALIAQTDALGHAMLANDLPRLDVRCVRLGAAARTVALECGDANIMLSHAGPVAGATIDEVGALGLQLLAEADAVAVVNWSATAGGSDLLRAVRAAAPEAWLYMDTGDLTRRTADIPDLLAAVRDARVDVWSLNEHEARVVFGDDPSVAAKAFSRQVGTRMDLHTRRHATSIGREVVHLAAHEVPGRKSTGAGDHWNAGNLAGDLLGLRPIERLQLAHDAATAHVLGRPFP